MPAEAAVSYYEAVGRRRVATARVRLYVNADNITVSGNALVKGAVSVNGKSSDEYFPGDVSKRNLLEPFRTTNTLNRFAVSVKTRGGGLQGQLGAVILGISRALLKVDLEKFRPILKKRGFLTRDPRAKQRRKAGFAHKARARKQSPKR
ncbi:30S ribosomal protein S9 [Candidatus Gottesmanbacteria bacterium RBG_16_52_11]|uniref:30S ribosomal protein S9 n=1 Tax=Candidatus Gottesmanbacteria bacterium RBG_16_52_11 TaxID=1798374 RepID=A0A1F5YY30_9BACT|nr:MAG: 30S ribosomal protein S9 [Candidatus Gottesmanbacteria bacterium RBG_16_52_11]